MWAQLSPWIFHSWLSSEKSSEWEQELNVQTMKQSHPKIEKIQKEVQEIHLNTKKSYAMRRIIEPKPNQTYMNKNMSEVNCKLVHNRSPTWCGISKHRFESIHTCNKYKPIHNILRVWKKTYKCSENIKQPIQPLWIRMGISAKNEEHIINDATNTSTYPSIHQIPTVGHGFLMPLSNAKC